MEDLPAHLLTDILSRLPTSADLAAARLSCRALRALSAHVSAVALLCSDRRYLRSRHPDTRALTLPFKTLVLNSVSLLAPTLAALSVGIEMPFAAADDDDEIDDADDLHLTAAGFVAGWVAIAGGGLRRVEISDYWAQSCWRRSEALAVISDGCSNLHELVVRNAWLSVDGLKPMPKLTSLILEFIRLDDEDLTKVNECFPSLQVLNLNGVGGLKDPKILLPHLRTCHWTVSNYPFTLSIQAPNLTELKLHCIDPRALILETPSLSRLNLTINKLTTASNFGKLSYLKSFSFESSCLQTLMLLLRSKSVEKLELEVPQSRGSDEASAEIVTMLDLVDAYPNVTDLTLGPGAWTNLERSFERRGVGPAHEWRKLKKLTVYVPVCCDFTFVLYILNLCVPFCEVILLVHCDLSTDEKNNVVSRCKSNFSKIAWGWGVWQKYREFSWI